MSETGRRALRAGLTAAGLAAAALIVVYLLRPPCPILAVTGLACPGCGAQRMIRALLRGDLAGAFHHNPFLFLLTPLLLGYVLWEAARYIRGKPSLIQRRGTQIALGLVVLAGLLFMVLRNLPGFEFLGP